MPGPGLVAWPRRLRCHPRAATLALVVALHCVPLRKSIAEDRVDFKTLFYNEGNGRMSVTSPSLQWETDLTPSLNLRISAVYDMISGASPTGAPQQPRSRTITTYVPVAATPAPTYTPSVSVGGGSGGGGGYDDDGGEDDDDRRVKSRRVTVSKAAALPAASSRKYAFKAGATPTPTPPPTPTPQPSTQTPSGGSSSSSSSSSTPVTTAGGTSVAQTQTVADKNGTVPKADVEDERLAFTLDLTGRIGRHTPGLQLAYSSEQDYTSLGIAVRDAIDFNKKNTTLTLGVAANLDKVEGAYMDRAEDKRTFDAMVGLTQLIDSKSFITANLIVGQADGFLNDPYKVVELNGTIVPEKRPDSKDKTILYLAWTRFFDEADGSLELGYRRYSDSFGIGANTLSAAWYQKLGSQFILRPAVRFYNQTAADFYDVRFAGSPDVYSADYRLSDLQSWGYGLKLIWQPSPTYAFDVSVDRYVMSGTDNVTSDDAYTGSTLVMVGFRVML